MDKTIELSTKILQANKKTIKYEPPIDCPTKFISNIISILNHDKLFNVIVKEFSEHMKLKELRLGTGTKQMLFLSFNFIHRYYPHFNIIDFIVTTDYFQVTYRNKGENSDRQKTTYMLYYFGKTNKSKYYIPTHEEQRMWSLIVDEYCKDLI